MQDFEKWFAQQGLPAQPQPLEPISVRCCGCGEFFVADYVESEEEADGMKHYCGRAPRCCP